MKFDSFSLDKKNQYKADSQGKYRLHVIPNQIGKKEPKTLEKKIKLKNQAPTKENTLLSKNTKLNQIDTHANGKIELLKSYHTVGAQGVALAKENKKLSRVDMQGGYTGVEGKDAMYYKNFEKKNSINFVKKG